MTLTQSVVAQIKTLGPKGEKQQGRSAIGAAALQKSTGLEALPAEDETSETEIRKLKN